MHQALLPRELLDHLSELASRLNPLVHRVQAWLAGGFAVRNYTQHRMSGDVGIKWSHTISIPPDLQVFEIGNSIYSTGSKVVAMDGSFADVPGSFPPEREERSREVPGLGNILLHIIDPVDLEVSKFACFGERDREDTQILAQRGLIDPDLFARRADEALSLYVGDLTFVRRNLADAKEIIALADIPANEA